MFDYERGDELFSIAWLKRPRGVRAEHVLRDGAEVREVASATLFGGASAEDVFARLDRCIADVQRYWEAAR